MIGNRLIVAGAVAAAALLALPATAQKVGVIEVQRIVQESAVGKESLARIQKIQAAKQEDLTKRQNDLRDLEKKIQEQGKSLSEEAMEKLQKDYQAKALDLKRFQDDAQRELEELQRKELGELERRVLPVIEAVSKELGYALVFNKFQSGLLHAEPGVDITDAVIQKFNTAIAAAPKTDAKPAPRGARPRPRRSKGRMAGLPAATTAAVLAAACGGRLVGDGAAVVEGVRSLEKAGPRDLSFAADARAEGPAAASAAGVLLARSRRPVPGPDRHRGSGSLRGARRGPRRAAFPRRVGAARRPPDGDRRGGSARRPRSRGRTLRRGRRRLGGGGRAILEAHVVVGRRCRIAAEAWLHPHVVLYDDVSVGPRTEVHSGAVLGADGFGYAPGPAGLRKDSPGGRGRDRRRRRDRREHLRRSGAPSR